MSTVATGTIEFVGMKSGNTNIKMDNGEWYSFFKTEVVANKGDNVEFAYVQKGKWFNGDASTFKVLEQSQSSPKTTSNGGSKGVDWDAKDRRIVYLASRKDALNLTELLIANDALKLPAKIADKMGVIVETVKQLTDDLFEDVYNAEGYPNIPIKDKNNNGLFTEEEMQDEE